MSEPFEPVELPSKYIKTIVAVVTAVVTVLAAALTDGVVTVVELAHVGIAFLTALAVYVVPNAPEGWRHYAKAVVAVLGTALQALVPFLVEGHVSPAQWLLVLLAGLGALTVGVVPNVSAHGSYLEEAERDLTPPEEGWSPRHRGGITPGG